MTFRFIRITKYLNSRRQGKCLPGAVYSAPTLLVKPYKNNDRLHKAGHYLHKL